LLGKINNFDLNRVTELETQINNLDNTYATNDFVTKSIDEIKGEGYDNKEIKPTLMGL
jgi:hypothetical protein